MYFMKKTLIMASLLVFAAASSAYAVENVPAKDIVPAQKTQCNCQRPPKGPDFQKRHAEFEQRLKLTDEQKAKAKELRQKGFEEMKPVMDKIKEKRQEIEAVKLSRMAVQAQNEKIEQLKREIGALKKEMHRIRMENMKKFEELLTKSQLKELKKMKEEGRKRFDKEFKKQHHPQFGPRPGCICPPPKHEPMPLPDNRLIEER